MKYTILYADCLHALCVNVVRYQVYNANICSIFVFAIFIS